MLISPPKVFQLSEIAFMATSVCCAAFNVSPLSDLIRAALNEVAVSMYLFADIPAVL